MREITVIDLDDSPVKLSVFKHQNGGLFALDSSYIEQVLPEDEDCWIPDPFNDDTNIETDGLVLLKGM